MRVGKSVRRAGGAAAVAGLAALGLVAMAQAQAPAPLKIGVMEGFSGVYGDLDRRRGRGHADGDRRCRRQGARPPGRDPVGRPSDQARHRRPIARKWYDVDGVKMITGIGTSSVALAVRKVAQEKGLIDINTGAASADLTGPACSETGAHWVYDTYALAHVTGERHGEGRRRHLVLPHRRLRLRPCAGARRHRGREGGGRQGAGRRPPSAQHAGLLVLPAAGPGLQGQDHRSRQCRPGHDQLDQAGGRVRHRQGWPAARRPAGLRDRRAVADPAGRAGPGADRVVLLGPERRDPRLDQALPRQEGQDARAC